MSLTPLPRELPQFLKPYLPSRPKHDHHPFVTLTWAQSLDSKILAAPGVRTVISHAETKTMTHYLRSRHQAILVGVGTALADDPKLSCRYPDESQPSTIRPVIVDPQGRWDYSSLTLYQLNATNKALAPFIIVNQTPENNDNGLLLLMGGAYITVPFKLTDTTEHRLENWRLIFTALKNHNIDLVMVEGGATIINDLLVSDYVDSIIITIGPVFLGSEGTSVAPSHGLSLLRNVRWWTGTQDAIMAARPPQ